MRVAVMDPLPLFREGVSTVLAASGYAVEAPDDVVKWVPQDSTSLVLLTLTADSGWDVLDALHRRRPGRPVIAVLDPLTATTGVRAVRAGARSLLSRGDAPRAFTRVVDATAEGQSVLPAPVLVALAEAGRGEATPARPVSEEHLDWLRKLASGVTITQLASEVGYSERAMYRLLRVVYRSVGADNRLQAVLAAQQRGWLEVS